MYKYNTPGGNHIDPLFNLSMMFEIKFKSFWFSFKLLVSFSILFRHRKSERRKRGGSSRYSSSRISSKTHTNIPNK
jgi:hypothetical protein